jgi:GTP cyclohydrolase I
MYRDNLQKILEELCPHNLAEFEYNGFLNKSSNTNIKKLGFSLGLSINSIQEAINKNVNCLVVHNSPENIESKKGKYFLKIRRLLIENDVSLYRLHLPLDFAKGGIIDQLCKILQFKAKPTELIYEGKKIRGGVYLAKNNMSLSEVIDRVQLLNPRTARVVRGRKSQVKNIAITSGDGCKPEFLLQLKPDVFICGLLNQESVRIADDLGITLIEATSYATESGPMKKFVAESKKYFPGINIEFIDIKNDVEMI